jgi:hypothetical protein
MMKWMKANKSWYLASEPQSIIGMLVLHTMSWDWLSPMLKNAARDIDPCMKAIAVKCKYLNTYCPKMLQDRFIGALHCIVEETLTPGIKKVQIINTEEKLTSMQVWVRWYRITLSKTQESPDDVLIAQQHEEKEYLILKNQNCEAISKLIGYILNMPIAHSLS